MFLRPSRFRHTQNTNGVIIRVCWMASYSRMLDMGGVPSSMHKKTGSINASKNCKVQAICFDFGTLTGSISSKEKEKLLLTKVTRVSNEEQRQELGEIMPKITQIADILNVKMGNEERISSDRTLSSKEVADLSRLMEADSSSETKVVEKETNPLLRSDVRSKYAARLARKGVDLAGVDRMKQRLEDERSNSRGDAASHFAARKIALSEPSAASGDKWMALTGTGALLQYLTQRSMKICLFPSPTSFEISNKEERDRMEQMKAQLNDVNFHSLIKTGSDAEHVLQTALRDLALDSPLRILVVSDRDEYIRVAKESGLVTCRIIPPNARRGNVSAHYSVPSVPDVKDVVDEINGISFNAVLQGR
ncbi:hypothetical protein FisN_2Lh428 [Fistulifera solaris]|uniref:Uncharacterized protein n=1 Tax=Fistulifera solaris TaxID=1519565 RepID=A0A1Z5JPM8_FISSO|nr:hypothetical protein FisN_2Lh428 [Fistulifera solaris]|eukprot:GAX15846.1 hypothetical protein FisN_2Lh428 [Fistulifera solaris]